MAKFIIEVSDSYIRERADVNNLVAFSKQEDVKFPRLMVDLISFSSLERKIDEGVNEFVISSDNLDEKVRKLFNDTLTQVASLALITAKEKQEE